MLDYSNIADSLRQLPFIKSCSDTRISLQCIPDGYSLDILGVKKSSEFEIFSDTIISYQPYCVRRIFTNLLKTDEQYFEVMFRANSRWYTGIFPVKLITDQPFKFDQWFIKTGVIVPAKFDINANIEYLSAGIQMHQQRNATSSIKFVFDYQRDQVAYQDPVILTHREVLRYSDTR